jgi:hypothetical protein
VQPAWLARCEQRARGDERGEGAEQQRARASDAQRQRQRDITTPRALQRREHAREQRRAADPRRRRDPRREREGHSERAVVRRAERARQEQHERGERQRLDSLARDASRQRPARERHRHPVCHGGQRIRRSARCRKPITHSGGCLPADPPVSSHGAAEYAIIRRMPEFACQTTSADVSLCAGIGSRTYALPIGSRIHATIG